MNKKNILFSGFMLFSLFFGAGNLIFPPVLGMESGNYFVAAIIGFILTAVFLPLLSIIAISLSNNGLLSIGQRVHPVFGIIFTIIIYMSIGAFYGIPRAANVAYELGLIQIIHSNDRWILLLFSILFFLITYLISLNPKKIIDFVGQLLTPALIIVLATLFIKAFMTFHYTEAPPNEDYQSMPFLKGFLNGYFTMDAVAALAFGIVVTNGLKNKGATNKKELIRGTVIAGCIAAIGLIIVYLSLSWIGRVVPNDTGFKNGAEILVSASEQLFGFGGNILFGVIVILACLTTCVGLINACSSFFNELYPKLSYKNFVRLFVFVGLLFSNLGLDLILQIAEPMLSFIYPIAIVLVMLSLFQHFFGESKKMYVYAICVTVLFAVYDLLGTFGGHLQVLDNVLNILPLYADGLGWLLPTFIFAAIGYIIDKSNQKIMY